MRSLALVAALLILTPGAALATDIGRLEERARAGDANAAFALALAYDGGDTVEADPTRAYRWYLEAALAGHPSAQFNVAIFLDAGRGVARDLEAAALWYGRAAARGHARAGFNLAMLYAAGEGVPRNAELAAAWYSSVARELPAARERVSAQQALAAQAGPVDAVTAPGPMAEQPVLVKGQDGWLGELVWTLPPQPQGAQVLLDLVQLDAYEARRLATRFEDRSATLVALPDEPAAYAWRLYSVHTRTARFAAGPWRTFFAGRPSYGSAAVSRAALAQLPLPEALAGLLPLAPDDAVPRRRDVETAAVEPLRVVITPRRTVE